MSQNTEQPQATTSGEQPTEVGEPSEQAERIAKAVIVAVALLAAWGLVAALPEIAYVVTGVLICLGWQKARARLTRRDDDQEPGEEAVEVDVAAALRDLSGAAGTSVLLTTLRNRLKLPDTKAVKALLDEAGIPHKAVRTPAGNGPGVHKADIPPAPSSTPDAHDERCCCRSGDNANDNNATGEGAEEGFRVVPIGTDGRIVYDPADTNRHHTV